MYQTQNASLLVSAKCWQMKHIDLVLMSEYTNENTGNNVIKYLRENENFSLG